MGLDECDAPCDDDAMIDQTRLINAKGSYAPQTRGNAQMAQTLTPKEIALELGVSPKTLRKFLREDVRGKGLESPGKGKRWEIARRDLKGIKSRFAAWQEERAKKEEAPETVEAPEVPEPAETPEGDAMRILLEGAESPE